MRSLFRFTALATGLSFSACGCASSPPSEGEPAQAVAAPEKEPRADHAATADAGAPASPAKPEVPQRLEIALRGVEALKLVEFLAPGVKRGAGAVQLVGEVAVSITNPSPVPVRLVHMNPANLVFTRVDSGAVRSMVHPCDPGFLLGSMGEPVRVPADGEHATEGSTVFTLGPGATRTFEMGDEWGCSGGQWKPVPEPGEYRVEYRILRLPADSQPIVRPTARATIRDRLAAARNALASEEFWDGAYRSEPVKVIFGAPRAKRLGD